MSDNFTTENGIVVAEETTTLWKGKLAQYFPEIKKLGKLEFLGEKMPLAIWKLASSIMKLSHKLNDREAQLFFFYNPESKVWRVFVPHQTAESGLATSISEEQADQNKKLLSAMGPDWWQVGTLHHHNTSAAFQSGTDSSDELESNGFHVTLGNLDKKTYSVDIRATLRGVQYEIDLAQIFGFPKSRLCDVFEEPVPKSWMSRIVVETPEPPSEFVVFRGANRSLRTSSVWTPSSPKLEKVRKTWQERFRDWVIEETGYGYMSGPEMEEDLFQTLRSVQQWLQITEQLEEAESLQEYLVLFGQMDSVDNKVTFMDVPTKALLVWLVNNVPNKQLVQMIRSIIRQNRPKD